MKKFILFLSALAFIFSSYSQVNPMAKNVRESGIIPSAGVFNPKTTAFAEGFETFIPPASLNGWTINTLNTSQTWDTASYNPYSGFRCMHCLYDDLLNPQSEWLITPLLDFSPATLVNVQFYWNGSKYWSVYPFNNCDLFFKYSTDGGSTWSSSLWSEHTDTAAFVSWTWAVVNLNVPAASACSTVKFAFQYYGTDGAEFSVDDFLIDTIGGIFVGIENFLHEQERVKLYPNPATDILTINTAEAINELRIYNSLGSQIIMKNSIQSRSINVSMLSEGLYYAVILTDKGKYTRKFNIVR